MVGTGAAAQISCMRNAPALQRPCFWDFYTGSLPRLSIQPRAGLNFLDFAMASSRACLRLRGWFP